jgi:RNA-directed DNA polymerase
MLRGAFLDRLGNDSNVNLNNRFNNDNAHVSGIALLAIILMQKPQSLYISLCSYDNLYLAYKKARKGKTTKDYVIEFEKNLKNNLLLLCSELLLHSYKPKPLVNFIVRDPKTRRISKSDFRDRIVHHALYNLIEPVFEKSFVYDSFANRIGKGTLKAIKRFDCFKRKASSNNSKTCFTLKADIKKYFENVDHKILINVIKKKIKDRKVLWLIRKILNNSAGRGETTKGMPLGNLTSQFFANVYLNELDNFVKHRLKAKYYIRYVDDFVILHSDRNILIQYKEEVNRFLKRRLSIELHPSKSKITTLGNRLLFLGFRVFYHHRLLKRPNLRKMKANYEILKKDYKDKRIDYDLVYDFLEGWISYAKHSNSYKLRKKILADFEREFFGKIPTKDINRYLKLLKKNRNMTLAQML